MFLKRLLVQVVGVGHQVLEYYVSSPLVPEGRRTHTPVSEKGFRGVQWVTTSFLLVRGDKRECTVRYLVYDYISTYGGPSRLLDHKQHE